MDITSREKAIIELIIKTSGKHTVLSIASSLNVSTRTIQRDLKATERIMEKFGLRLIRNMDQGLSIEGKNEQIYRLIQHIAGSTPIDQTPLEKKLRLLLAVYEEEHFKIQTLATHLGVSSATLAIYLDELAEWLEVFQLQLTRKRGVGVELHGTEANKRRALVHFFLQYFHDEFIENLFILEKGSPSEEKILHYFYHDELLEVLTFVNATFHKTQARVTDRAYLEVVLHIYITLKRTDAHFLLEEDVILQENEVAIEYDLMLMISRELERKLDVSLTKRDILFLALILKGTKLQGAEAEPDNILLAQLIKNVIRSVSNQLQVNLTDDFALFQGLLAHMEPALFRIEQKMESFNPLKEEIKRKYPVLFMAVKNSVKEEFKSIDYFPEDEIAFMVLHFGSALLMQEEHLTIKALVICPTGIGTSKMLASRIKKEIAEIDSVDIKSIKEVSEHVNLQAYDVIISTVRLPFINKEYVLVNPLLSTENIDTIKSFIQNNIEAIAKGEKYKKIERHSVPSSVVKKNIDLQDMLQDMKSIQQSIESILQNYRFYRMNHSESQELILNKMLQFAEKENLVTESEDILYSLKEREKRGGLGIPQTNLALFHARNKHVRDLIFQIAHLPNPCLVRGMDGNMVMMKNLLLMLAPLELSNRQQEIISLISTNIIETDEAILIFSSANEELIYKRLESIFSNYLQSNFKINDRGMM